MLGAATERYAGIESDSFLAHQKVERQGFNQSMYNYRAIQLVLARFIDASIYRDTFHAICIAIHFARIAILSVQVLTITILLWTMYCVRNETFIISANRAISRGDIHCALALTAARPAMLKLVCQCKLRRVRICDYICFGKPPFADVF